MMPNDKYVSVSSKQEAYLADFDAWISQNMLVSNYEKTEPVTSESGKIELEAEEMTVHVARSVKNSGVYFDASLIRERQVNGTLSHS